MERIYADLIKAGIKTIDDVPINLKKRVLEILHITILE